MPKIALTEISVRALKPAAVQTTFWDASLPNFGVRVGKQRKTFVVLVGVTERRRVTLGTYPELSIAKARQMARDKLYALQAAAEPKRPTATFSEALDLFLSTHSKQRHSPKTASDNKRILESYFKTRLGDRDVAGIKGAEVAKVLDGLQDRPSEMEHAFRVVRTFFNFL